MEDNKITITTPDNKQLEVEVLDIFNVEGYEGKDYIMYSLGEEVDEENEKVYISILKETSPDSFELQGITDDKEWDAVEKALEEKLSELDGE